VVRKTRRRLSVEEMFDVLPPPDTKSLRLQIRRRLKHVVAALVKVSLSAHTPAEPQWPAKQLLDSFARLVEEYRSATRSRRWPAYRIIREIDHRWPTYQLKDRLQKVVQLAHKYRGRSIRADVYSRCFYESDGISHDDKKTTYDRMRRFIFKKHKAVAADLDVMEPIMSSAFRHLYETLKQNDQPRRDATNSNAVGWRESFALVFQETLYFEYEREKAASFSTGHLKQFFDRIGTPEQRMLMRGFTTDQIAKWERTKERRKTLARVTKHRLAKKTRQLSVTGARGRTN
jgi:hypothetical protein